MYPNSLVMYLVLDISGLAMASNISRLVDIAMWIHC